MLCSIMNLTFEFTGVRMSRCSGFLRRWHTNFITELAHSNYTEFNDTAIIIIVTLYVRVHDSMVLLTKTTL